MDLITRIFCQSEEPPTLEDILAWLQTEEYQVSYDEDTLTAELDDTEWDTADLDVEDAEGIIQIDSLRESGENSMLYVELIEAFTNSLKEEEDIGEANPVQEHVANTNFIIQITVPQDSDSLCEDVKDALCNILCGNEEGIVMVEGDGFYDADGEILLSFDEE